MDKKIEPPELAIDSRRHIGDLRIARDIAGHHERCFERLSKLADVLFQTVALIGQREPGAGSGRRLSDGPGYRVFVCDSDDEAVFSGKVGHLKLAASRVIWIVCDQGRDVCQAGTSSEDALRRVAGIHPLRSCSQTDCHGMETRRADVAVGSALHARPAVAT